MAVASLKSRIAKLEAKRMACRVVGVVGCRPEFRNLTPERFKVLARDQHARLQLQLLELANELGHDEDRAANVGTSPKVRPDGFVFEYMGEDFVVIDGEPQPVKKRKH